MEYQIKKEIANDAFQEEGIDLALIDGDERMDSPENDLLAIKLKVENIKDEPEIDLAYIDGYDMNDSQESDPLDIELDVKNIKKEEPAALNKLCNGQSSFNDCQINSGFIIKDDEISCEESKGEDTDVIDKTESSYIVNNEERVKTSRTSNSSEVSLVCEECGRSFSNLDGLQSNLEIYTGEKPFKCKECRWPSSQLQETLTEERPFECRQCGKSFSRPALLLRHMRTHTGERPFHCKDCNKSFSQENNLQRHKLKHSGERPFDCKDCGKSFSQLTHLKRHTFVHTREKPFRCKECNKSSSQLGNLQRHNCIKAYRGETLQM